MEEAELVFKDKRPRYLEVTPPQGKEYICNEFYTLAPRSIRTNDWDKLELSRYIDLIPLCDAINDAKKFV